MNVHLSEERKNQLKKEYKLASCTNKKDESLVNNFPIDAVYDKASAQINFNKVRTF